MAFSEREMFCFTNKSHPILMYIDHAFWKFFPCTILFCDDGHFLTDVFNFLLFFCIYEIDAYKISNYYKPGVE